MKRILSIAFVLLFAIASNAQLKVGLKGAVGLSKISADIQNLDAITKTGYQLGGYVRLGKKLHLQPEIYFASKNGKFDFNTQYDPDDPQNTKTNYFEQEVKLKSIDVPVLIGYRIIKLADLHFHIQAGPVASVVVSKKFDITFNGAPGEEDDSPIIADDFSNINWGLQFGAGIDFHFLTADLRYELGMNNIFDSPESWVQNVTMKNNLLFISVGFKIFSL